NRSTVNAHFSDHRAQVIKIEIPDQPIKDELVSNRIFSVKNTYLFLEEINKVNWQCLNLLGCEEGFNWFHDNVMRCVHSCFPERKFNERTIRMNRADPDHTISRVKGDQLSKELYERLKDKYKSHPEKSIPKRDLQMLNSDDNKSKAICSVINENKAH
ncbi:hypothetical protein HHI36_002508, partial [Cryptolaemus montrouzieri]